MRPGALGAGARAHRTRNRSRRESSCPLFELGNPNPFTPDLDPATLAKSADPRLLAGHRVWSEPDRPTIQIDDTWSFKGSD